MKTDGSAGALFLHVDAQSAERDDANEGFSSSLLLRALRGLTLYTRYYCPGTRPDNRRRRT